MQFAFTLSSETLALFQAAQLYQIHFKQHIFSIYNIFERILIYPFQCKQIMSRQNESDQVNRRWNNKQMTIKWVLSSISSKLFKLKRIVFRSFAKKKTQNMKTMFRFWLFNLKKKHIKSSTIQKQHICIHTCVYQWRSYAEAIASGPRPSRKLLWSNPFPTKIPWILDASS